MNCAELEQLICDYVDGTLTADRKADVERHLEACPACADMARDSAAAKLLHRWLPSTSWLTRAPVPG